MVSATAKLSCLIASQWINIKNQLLKENISPLNQQIKLWMELPSYISMRLPLTLGSGRLILGNAAQRKQLSSSIRKESVNVHCLALQVIACPSQFTTLGSLPTKKTLQNFLARSSKSLMERKHSLYMTIIERIHLTTLSNSSTNTLFLFPSQHTVVNSIPLRSCGQL